LDLPTRLYQRLIADDAEEAIEIAVTEIEKSTPRDFYNHVGIPVLRLASEDHLRNATAEHRLRAANGMDALLDDLREQYPSQLPGAVKPNVICIGGKWELDTVASEMLAHALTLDGIPAEYRPTMTISSASLAKLDLGGAEVVCISYFTTAPTVPARHFVRRLLHRWPNMKIVLALWNSPEGLLNEGKYEELGVQDVVTSIDEAVARIHRLVAPYEAKEAQKAVVPDNDEDRVTALEATGVLSGSAREDLDALATRAAEVFNVGFAVISAIDRTDEYIIGQSKPLPGPRTQDGDMLVVPRDEAVCNYLLADAETLVIPDANRDPRVADNPTLQRWNARFYAGAPLRSADGFVFGALCLLDREPHTLDEREIELLNTMAADVVAIMTGEDAAEPPEALSATSTATVGQRVPK
jgi:hypothetical protein